MIYCGFTKGSRSHNAAVWSKSLGCTNLYCAPAGITAWKDAGNPFKTITEYRLQRALAGVSPPVQGDALAPDRGTQTSIGQ